MRKTKSKANLLKRLLINIIYISIALLLIIGSGILLLLNTLELPNFSDFENRKLSNSTKIYDRTGEVLLFNLHENTKRTAVRNEDISDWIKKATISVEDRNFYTHPGVSIISILRAMYVNITSGKYAQGGSTINQQIIKNSLLTTEKSIDRKIKEFVLAIKLDNELSKEAILNIYLNDSPYGGSIYGVEEASLTYFNKHAKDVTINEAAYLASIPKSPTRLSPFGNNIKELENRKNTVLWLMYQNGYITEEQYRESENKYITFVKNDFSSGKAHHFVFMVKKYLEEKYGYDTVESLGLKVTTTLDWKLQKQSEDILNKEFEKYIKNNDTRNVSFILADPRTGQILSLIGSRNYFDKTIDGQFNAATGKRNPGSSFKPFIYLRGFMNGLTPESIIFDAPTQFGTNCINNNNKDIVNCYSPQNYTGLNYGPVSARVALQNSLNIPAVKMLYIVGLSNMLDFAGQFGIESYTKKLDTGLSLALGGGSVSLYEMIQGYSVLANNGTKNDLHFILEVKDNKGNILEKENLNPIQIVPEKYVSALSDVLSDNKARNLVFSVNNSMYFGDRPVAAKTGTTQDYKDAWIFGYTPSVVSGLWIGTNDYKSISGGAAGDTAGPIWKKIMLEYFKDKEIERFPVAEKLYDDKSPEILKGNWCNNPNILSVVSGATDPQYNLWQVGIDNWLQSHINNCNGNNFGINATNTILDSENTGIVIDNNL